MLRISFLARAFLLPAPCSGRHFSQNVKASEIFLQVSTTPNPDALKFYPGLEVTGSKSYDIRSRKQAEASPLAKTLFKIPGVTGVFFGSDFISVTKKAEAEWGDIKPVVFTDILDHFAAGGPIIYADRLVEDSPAEGEATAVPSAPGDGGGDSEVVLMIKELLDTRIRPSVQEDGGDVQFIRFEEGIVYLQLQGSCSGCPSSSVTLKSGIERTIMYWIPEVVGCVAVNDDELEALNEQQFKEVEQRVTPSD